MEEITSMRRAASKPSNTHTSVLIIYCYAMEFFFSFQPRRPQSSNNSHLYIVSHRWITLSAVSTDKTVVWGPNYYGFISHKIYWDFTTWVAEQQKNAGLVNTSLPKIFSTHSCINLHHCTGWHLKSKGNALPLFYSALPKLQKTPPSYNLIMQWLCCLCPMTRCTHEREWINTYISRVRTIIVPSEISNWNSMAMDDKEQTKAADLARTHHSV